MPITFLTTQDEQKTIRKVQKNELPIEELDKIMIEAVERAKRRIE